MTDDRAELAFREALATQAERFEPETLAPLTPPTRRWWPTALAAAAVLVLVGAAAVLLPGDDGKVPVSTGTPTGPADLDGPGAPPEGWHWESSLDAVVAVPDSWGYAYAAGDQWCVGAEEPAPTTPFVDLRSPVMASTAVLCPEQDPDNFTGVPERLLQTHLSFAWADVPDGTRTWHGWTQITRHVGSAVVQVLADAKHLEVAQQVIDSARQVDVDANGCTARSPIQEGGFVRPQAAFDVTSVVPVEKVVICQYLIADADQPGAAEVPGLMASRRLDDEAGRALVAAIQAAPSGGGPNQPDSCVHTWYGDTAVTIRLTSGERTYELYAYYGSCIGNGIDDGTTLRTLTPDTCAPLFGDRVFWGSGSGHVADLCLPPRA
jgi:hypothetical protein